MATVSAVFDRAETLRGHGLTNLRIFWRLRREFRNVERDILLRASRIEGAPGGVTPGWALWGQPLRSCQIRFKTKEMRRPEDKVTVRTRKVISVDYPLLTVEANDLREGDWIENVGHVESAWTYKKHTYVGLADDALVFPNEAPVQIRLEDKGETS